MLQALEIFPHRQRANDLDHALCGVVDTCHLPGLILLLFVVVCVIVINLGLHLQLMLLVELGGCQVHLVVADGHFHVVDAVVAAQQRNRHHLCTVAESFHVAQRARQVARVREQHAEERSATPQVDLGRQPFLKQLGDAASFDSNQHSVIDAAGKSRDEEGLLFLFAVAVLLLLVLLNKKWRHIKLGSARQHNRQRKIPTDPREGLGPLECGTSS